LVDHLSLASDDRETEMELDLDPRGISAAWKALVQRPGPGLTVDRRQFEVYAFCEVAKALKAGEVFLPGSLAFADYRDNLVARDPEDGPCAAFLRDRGLPARPQEFVEQLRTALAKAACNLDQLFELGCRP